MGAKGNPFRLAYFAVNTQAQIDSSTSAAAVRMNHDGTPPDPKR